jgi:hypothetical protein
LAFAAILEDGSVVAGGHPDHGGDCSSLQDQLRNVRQIAATGSVFAAILSDGSLVGATQTVEVTAQRFKSSLRICNVLVLASELTCGKKNAKNKSLSL